MYGLFALSVVPLSMVYCWLVRGLHVRHFNRLVAHDVLNDWTAQLELLDAQAAQAARRNPPVEVLKAQLALPPAFRDGLWSALPLEPAHR